MSSAMNPDHRIEQALEDGYAFLKAHHDEWDLHENCELEYTNHVVRTAVQGGVLDTLCPELPMRLAGCQNGDGGWGDHRDDDRTEARSTAFSVQMLIRAYRASGEQDLRTSIEQGVRCIVASQAPAGNWVDSSWHAYDATSTSVGTLLFARNEQWLAAAPIENALRRGIDYIVRARGDDGLWRFKPHGSAVEITAHLLPKCVSYRGWLAEDAVTLRGLLALQGADGSWDGGNTDHTCDALRASMMAGGMSRDTALARDVAAAAERAVGWLLALSEAAGGGLGDRAGTPAHSERTADLIDSLLKYKQFKRDSAQMFQFWN